MTMNLRRRAAGLGVAAAVLTAGSLWIGNSADRAPEEPRTVALDEAEQIASFHDLLAWLSKPTTTTKPRVTTTTRPRATTTTRPPVTTTTRPAVTTTTKAPVTTTTKPRPVTTTAVRPVPTTAPPATAPPATPPPATAPPAPVGNLAAATQNDLLAQVNARRATGVSCGGTWYPAAPALSLHSVLGKAAQAHATDMATSNYFSHTGLNGSSPGDRISAAGYHWRAWSENIAAGQATTTAVVNGWFGSTGHCQNFMSRTVTQVGFGMVQNPSSTYRIYWVANLAAPF
jgi:uncharacterized protein YkwD